MAQPAAAPAEDNPRNSRIYIDIPLGPRKDAVVTGKGFQIRSSHAYFLYAGDGCNPMAVHRTFDIDDLTYFVAGYHAPSPNSRLWIAGVPHSVNILADYHGPTSQGMDVKEVEEWDTPLNPVRGYHSIVHNHDRAPRSETTIRHLHRDLDDHERKQRVRLVTDPAVKEYAEQALAKARAELEIDRVFLMYQTAVTRFGNKAQAPSARQTLENYLSFGG